MLVKTYIDDALCDVIVSDAPNEVGKYTVSFSAMGEQFCEQFANREDAERWARSSFEIDKFLSDVAHSETTLWIEDNILEE